MISFERVLDVVESFYEKAVTDFLIGYHFRKIEDFDAHIPRIAAFWQLQLTGKTDRKHELPFRLLEAHRPLGIKKGELGRWVVLFKQNLDKYVRQKTLDPRLAEIWKKKVDFFEEKLTDRLI